MKLLTYPFSNCIKLSAIFWGSLLGIQTASAEAALSRKLLVVSKVDHVLAIVDPTSLKVLNRIPIGPDPHEVLATPDGKCAYVSNPGYGAFHELNQIDLVNEKALTPIDTTPLLGPHGLAFVQNKLWMTAQGSKSVARLDPATNKIDWTMGTGQDTTHMIYVRGDGELIATTNVDSGTVSIFEYKLVQPSLPPTGVMPPALKPHLDWVQTLLPVGKGAEGFDVSPDGKELWTATPQGRLSIIDVDAKEIRTTVELGELGVHRMKFTPDGKQVVMCSVRTGSILIYDVASRKEIKRLQTGHGASMVMDSLGQRAFIACTPDNFIAVLDLKKLELCGRLEVGGRPDGMTFTNSQN